MANLEGAARSIVVDIGRGASSVSAARLCTSLCRGVTVWRNPASGLFVREKSSCVYLHAAGRETGRRCLAEGESPCGVRDCTLRRVLEYLPQSTRVLSARRAGGLRTTMRGFGGGRGRQAPKQVVPGGALLRACRWRGGVRIVDSVSASLPAGGRPVPCRWRKARADWRLFFPVGRG